MDSAEGLRQLAADEPDDRCKLATARCLVSPLLGHLPEVQVLILSAVALAMLASFGAPPAGLPYDAMPGVSQAGSAVPSPSPGEHAIRVRLSTLVDHFDLFAGQLVQLPPSRVSRILSPTLAELRDAREHGPFSFHHWDEDRVLVRLPAGAKILERGRDRTGRPGENGWRGQADRRACGRARR